MLSEDRITPGLAPEHMWDTLRMEVPEEDEPTCDCDLLK